MNPLSANFFKKLSIAAQSSYSQANIKEKNTIYRYLHLLWYLVQSQLKTNYQIFLKIHLQAAAVVLLLCAAAAAPTAVAYAGYGYDIPTVPGIDYERAARLRAAPPPPPPRAPPRPVVAPAVAYAAQPYSYAYDVVDPAAGLNYGKQERSDGAGVVTGEYRVLLPDGRTQVVR